MITTRITQKTCILAAAFVAILTIVSTVSSPSLIYALIDPNCPGGTASACNTDPFGRTCTTWKYCNDPSNPGNSSFFCYKPASCSDGSTTCGTCPDPEEPPPGGGGGGSSSSSSSSCALAQPSAPPLFSPADNAVVNGFANITFTWGQPSDWGLNCPIEKRLTLQLDKGCTATYKNYAPDSGPAGTSKFFNQLESDTQYCWRVRACNPTRCQVSVIRRLRTQGTTDITSSGIDSDSISKCSGQYTGRTDSPNANNPIRYFIQSRDVRNDFLNSLNYIDNVVIAIFPSTVASSGTLTWGSVYKNIGKNYTDYPIFMVNNIDGVRTYYSLNSGTAPYWSAGVTSGNLANAAGNGTLLNINADGGTQTGYVGNDIVRTDWQIRIENSFPSGNVYMYAWAFADAADITDGSKDSSLIERRQLWRVDMERPSAAIGAPIFRNSYTYDLQWQGADNVGIGAVRSYCYVDSGTYQIRDNGAGVTMTLDAVPKAYPDATNCIVDTVPELVLRRYIVPGAVPLSKDINYGLYLEDLACNPVSATQRVSPPAEWLITAGSDAHAQAGFGGFNIADVADSVLTAISATLANDDYLATYLSLSGNSSMLGDRQSKQVSWTTGYDNWHVKPPQITGYTEWYDLIRDTLQKKGLLVTKTHTVMGGTFSVSANYNVAAGSRNFFIHNGDLAISGATVCNIKAVILVAGNLTIAPGITNTAGNGCMYVVNGNIIVTGGPHRSAGLAATAASRYDNINAFLITDGTFTTTPDRPVATNPADGLYVKGSVIADQVSLGRTLYTNNSTQPSEVVEYDPFFMSTFRDVLSYNKFSIRER